jgi:CDP-4-dehydro-6-deoxyglucose reductase
VGFRIAIAGEDRAFEAAPGETVLAAATRAGVRLPHSCTLGNCGSCRVRLAEGAVTYDGQPLALSQAEAAEGFALACQARPEGDLVIEVPKAEVPEPSRQMALVTDVSPLAASVTRVALVLPELDPFVYLPGQHANLFLPDGTHRSFSMASAPSGNEADFHVRRIPGGRFTEGFLANLQPGDMIEAELPLGAFRLHAEDYRELVFVATGTGIAPIKAMLESLLDDPDCPPVSRYWGMRSEDELYLADTIASWEGRLYEFRCVPVLSRAGASWSGRRGHVQDAVLADFASLAEHSIYLCGSPAMIAGAKERFAARGASATHLYADGFSFQSGA